MHISEILVTTEKHRKLHAPMRFKISSVPINFCEPIDTKPENPAKHTFNLKKRGSFFGQERTLISLINYSFYNF